MEDVFEPEAPPQTGDPVDDLYRVVKDRGLYSKSPEEFRKQYSSQEQVDKLYQVVKDQGLYSKTKEDFYGKYYPAITKHTDLGQFKPTLPTAAKESTGVQGPAILKTIPAETTAEVLKKKQQEAGEYLRKTLTENNDLIPTIIKKQRSGAQASANLGKFAGAPRSDQPLTGAGQLGQRLQPQGQEQPAAVTDQDVADFVQNIHNEPTATRGFLQHVIQAKPAQSKPVQEALYMADAQDRADQNPLKAAKILKNAHDIAKGDLHYSVQGGQLIKPEGVWQSIGTGLKEKNKAFSDYDLFSNAAPDDAIKELERRRAEHDPDEAVPVPEGFAAGLSSGLASQPLKGLVAGKVAGAGTALIPGGQEFAPAVDKFVSAAVSGNDFRKMSYAHALQQNYNQLRNEGMSAEEAYHKANGQAKDESMVDAIVGGAMMYGAGAIGEIKLPSFAASGSFKNAVVNGLKQGAKGIGEAGVIGLIQGAGQEAKNALAEDKGIARSGSGEDTKEAIESGALFTLGLAALAKGGSLLSGKTRSTILQGISKVAPEKINEELGHQIMQGHITSEEAVTTKKDIDEHRIMDAGIPENVTDESRTKIQDKIKRRDYLESQLEAADKAFHPEIKEKIKAVNEDILELAKDKKPRGEEDLLSIKPVTNEQAETKAQTQGRLLNQQGGAESTQSGSGAAPSSENVSQNVPRENIKENDYVISKHYDGPRKIVHVSEDGQHVVVEDPGGDHIRHEIPIDEITLKVKSSASNVRTTEANPAGERPAIEGIGEGGKREPERTDVTMPVSAESAENTGTGQVEEPALTGISHARTDEVAKQYGLDTYEKNPETMAEWDAKADERIKSDPQTVPKLIKKLEESHEPDKIDQRVMMRYMASLKARIDENPSNELLAQYKHAKYLSDIVGGREVGKSLAARRGSTEVKDSLADYMTEDMESAGVDELTDQQKQQTKTEYENISKAEQAYKDKIASLEADNAKLKAEAELAKTKKAAPKGTKKTHDDFVKERKSYLDELIDLKEKAEQKLKDQGIQKMGIGFTFTGDMAKVVGKIVKSLVEEGTDKLEDVIKNVHEQLKDIFPGIEEKDVHDIIAGKYAEKKQSRNALAEKLRDLQTEASLINKLEDLENGIEPTSEAKKIERNKKIADLRKQIKEHDLTKLAAKKRSLKDQIEKVKEDLDSGNYLKDKEVEKPLELDEEAQELKDKLNSLKNEREIRLLREQYANRSKIQKSLDAISEVANVPRSLMSSLDFSAPFRQGVFGVTKQLLSTNKDLGAQKDLKSQFGAMFKMAKSQKAFDRYFSDLKDAPDYEVMQKAGLPLSNPLDSKLTVKEEAFMSNLAEKIPIIGRFIKGSERAYVGFLNKMRVDMFRRAADGFAASGKTFKNSPELYKAFADYVGAATGRGQMPEILEKSAPILNAAFFSPRLIASRLNLLTNWANPKFYTKIPKEVRVQYFKDMAKFIGTGMLVLGIAKMGGAEVEDDPRSSDFGKIKSGNTRWDIWGGFQQYVRLAAQMLTGEKKASTSGNITKLDGKGAFGQTRGSILMQFARGKLAPVPSEILDFSMGKDVIGNTVTIGSEAQKNLPLVLQDIAQAASDKGVQGALGVGIPSMFGVGVQTYEDKKGGGSGGGAGSGGKYIIKQWK